MSIKHLFVPVAECGCHGLLRIHSLAFRNQGIPGGAGVS